jgi:hypothetical protein
VADALEQLTWWEIRITGSQLPDLELFHQTSTATVLLRMAEPSTSTSPSTSEGGDVVLDTLTRPDDKPAPAQEPKRPEPTIPYSWRTFQPPITLEYVTDCDRADELLATLEPCVVGFDVEWKPVFLKGQPENKVALIQLANNEIIYLLQVSAMESKYWFIIYVAVCMD